MIFVRSSALCAALLAVPVRAADRPGIAWGARTLTLEALPAELPATARAALEQWSEFAAAHELRFDLDEEARLWIVGPGGGAAGERRRKLVEQAAAAFETTVPAFREARGIGRGEPPANPPPKKPKEEPPKPAEPIPEDPAGEFPWLEEGKKKSGGSTGKLTDTSWGGAMHGPDEGTCVLFACPNEEVLHALADELAKRHAWLASWTPEAKSTTGFVIEAPLAGAFVLEGEGLEEWDPDNELVHRVARLLLLRRFGQLPPWAALGVAWNVEHDVMGSIRVFPYRNDFVFVGEGTGWEKELRKRFAKQGKEPLAAETFTPWPKRKWDGDRARVAFGLVGFLRRQHKEHFGDLLAEFRACWLLDNRIELDGKSWKRDREYEVPPAKQVGLLQEICGTDVLVEAGRALRMGGDYQPPKQR